MVLDQVIEVGLRVVGLNNAGRCDEVPLSSKSDGRNGCPSQAKYSK